MNSGEIELVIIAGCIGFISTIVVCIHVFCKDYIDRKLKGGGQYTDILN